MGTLRGFQGTLLGTSKRLHGTFQSCPTRGPGSWRVCPPFPFCHWFRAPPGASAARHFGLSCHFAASPLHPGTTLGQTGRAGAVRNPHRTASAQRGVGGAVALLSLVPVQFFHFLQIYVAYNFLGLNQKTFGHRPVIIIITSSTCTSLGTDS